MIYTGGIGGEAAVRQIDGAIYHQRKRVRVQKVAIHDERRAAIIKRQAIRGVGTEDGQIRSNYESRPVIAKLLPLPYETLSSWRPLVWWFPFSSASAPSHVPDKFGPSPSNLSRGRRPGNDRTSPRCDCDNRSDLVSLPANGSRRHT